MAQLDTINADVLQLIIEHLGTRDNMSLSRVSRSIRDTCNISLFRTLVWNWSADESRSGERQRSGIPESLWGHVRNLTFHLEDERPVLSTSPVDIPHGVPVYSPCPPNGNFAVDPVSSEVAATEESLNHRPSSPSHEALAVVVTSSAEVVHSPTSPRHTLREGILPAPQSSLTVHAEPALSSPAVELVYSSPSPLIYEEQSAPILEAPSEATVSSPERLTEAIRASPTSSNVPIESTSPLPDLPAHNTRAIRPPEIDAENISDVSGERETQSSPAVSAPPPDCPVTVEITDAQPDVPKTNVEGLPDVSVTAEAVKGDNKLRPISEMLLKVLPKLRLLKSFHFRSDIRGPWPALLVALFKATNLQDISISGDPWDTPDQRFDEESVKSFSPKSITRFLYMVPFFYDTDTGRRGEPEGYAEFHNLSKLLPYINQELEYLELPSEIIDVVTGISFLRLKELTIVGPSPTFEWTETALKQTPNLHTLNILFSRQPLRPLRKGIVEEHPGFLEDPIIPPLELDDKPISVAVVECIAGLHSFTLSSPHPADRIFQCLPAGLTKLAFPSYPPGYRKFTHPIKSINTIAISSTRMLEVLQTLGHLEDLTHLELAYTIDTHESHEALMRFVCSTFAKLTSLEVHSYGSHEHHRRTQSRPELIHGTIDVLKEWLPRLSHLSRLKLNPDYPDLIRHSSHSGYEDPRQVRQNASQLRSFVLQLAEAVPSICSISMLTTKVEYMQGTNYWKIWKISRSTVTGEIDITPPDGELVFIPPQVMHYD